MGHGDGGVSSRGLAPISRSKPRIERQASPGNRCLSPFRRLWRWGCDRLELESVYFNRGPFSYDRAEELPGATEPLPSYEFHWTVGDYVTALLDAGCTLLALREFGEGLEDWEAAPLHDLPLSLLLVGRKDAEG